MDEITIRNLDEDYKNSKVAEKCYQGLLAWTERVGTEKAATQKLCTALRVAGYSDTLKTSRKYDEVNNGNINLKQSKLYMFQSKLLKVSDEHKVNAFPLLDALYI